MKKADNINVALRHLLLGVASKRLYKEKAFFDFYNRLRYQNFSNIVALY